jgi:hypothetical protein
MEDSFPCKCGHSFFFHDVYSEDQRCLYLSDKCKCSKFIVDNLKYLENKYDENRNI